MSVAKLGSQQMVEHRARTRQSMIVFDQMATNPPSHDNGCNLDLCLYKANNYRFGRTYAESPRIFVHPLLGSTVDERNLRSSCEY